MKKFLGSNWFALCMLYLFVVSAGLLWLTR